MEEANIIYPTIRVIRAICKGNDFSLGVLSRPERGCVKIGGNAVL